MRIFLWIILIYAAFVCRTTMPLMGDWAAYGPRLELALVFGMICPTGGTAGVVCAAGCGLLSDGLTGGLLGIDLVGFVVAGYALQLVVLRGGLHAPWSRGVATGAAVLATSLFSGGLRGGMESRDDFVRLLTESAGSAGATALLVFALCGVWGWIVGDSSEREPTSPDVANRWRMLTE
jgi:rod shape-determining protein MreD